MTYEESSCKSTGRELHEETGPQQGKQGAGGGVVKGPVSWSRRIGPYVALPADREPFPVYLSAVCRSAATASLSGAGRASCTTPRQGRAGGGR
jgi:hypothetical protein